MSVGLLVTGVAMGSLVFLGKTGFSLANYVEMNKESMHFLEQFSRDARMGVDVSIATPSQFDFESTAQVGVDQIVYEYSDDDMTITRTVNGVLDDTISGVTQCAFKYYSIASVETVNLIEVKEVQIEAVLARQALSVISTDHIISARFMLRNRRVSE